MILAISVYIRVQYPRYQINPEGVVGREAQALAASIIACRIYDTLIFTRRRRVLSAMTPMSHFIDLESRQSGR